MTRDEIQSQIISFIAEHFELEPDKVLPESKFFEDLDLDSIDAVELVLHLSEMTGEKIDEASIKDIVTISDVVDLVVKMQAEAAERESAGATAVETPDAAEPASASEAE